MYLLHKCASMNVLCKFCSVFYIYLCTITFLVLKYVLCRLVKRLQTAKQFKQKTKSGIGSSFCFFFENLYLALLNVYNFV